MTDPRPPLGVFRIVRDSLRVLLANFGFLFPLAFIPSLAFTAIDVMAGGWNTPADPAASPLFAFDAIAALLVSVVLGFVVSAVMALAAIDAVIGKRHALLEYLAQALRHIVPIVVIGMLVAIATGIGVVLFVLPGLYIAARYLPWTPAVVFENAGWSGLGRAQELTEGYRWPIVGAIVVLTLIIAALAVASAPALVALAGADGRPGLAGLLLSAALGGLYYAFTSVFTALVYARLREIHEGLSVADIAALIE